MSDYSIWINVGTVYAYRKDKVERQRTKRSWLFKPLDQVFLPQQAPYLNVEVKLTMNAFGSQLVVYLLQEE